MSPAARLLRGVVLGYRLVVSPLLGPRCRFAPTCSAYALEALQVHGAVRGSWLTLRRVSRCHPFHPGGSDPVPPARARSRTGAPDPGAAGRRISETGGQAGDGPPDAPLPPVPSAVASTVLAPPPARPATRLGAPS